MAWNREAQERLCDGCERIIEWDDAWWTLVKRGTTTNDSRDLCDSCGQDAIMGIKGHISCGQDEVNDGENL